MPVVAGGLKWAQQLQERIQIPYNNFRYIMHPWVFVGRFHVFKARFDVSHIRYNALYSSYLWHRWCPLSTRFIIFFNVTRCMESADGEKVMQKYEEMMLLLKRWVTHVLSSKMKGNYNASCSLPPPAYVSCFSTLFALALLLFTRPTHPPPPTPCLNILSVNVLFCLQASY